MKIKDRKLDTRRKIQMGGLVKKAGLEYLHGENNDILLGILIEGFENLHGNDAETFEYHYAKLGKEKFYGDWDEKNS